MIKFYMYVIYRLHEFFSKKDSTPIGNTVIVMCLIHFFQILTIGLYINVFYNRKLPELPKNPMMYFIAFLIYIAYYFIIFHNAKWKEWAKQFKKETSAERKKNGVRVWLFCWGSILLFFISLPLTFTIIRLLQ